MNIIIQVSKNKISNNNRMLPCDIPEYEAKKFAFVTNLDVGQRVNKIKEFADSLAPYAERKGESIVFKYGIHEFYFKELYKKFLSKVQELENTNFDAFASSIDIENAPKELLKTIQDKNGVYVIDVDRNHEGPVTFAHWLRELVFSSDNEDNYKNNGTKYYIGAVMKYGSLCG